MMKIYLILAAISIISFQVHAKSLKQATEHAYTTERYYLGLDSNRAIDEKLKKAKLKSDVPEQMRILCVDVRQFYQNVIALNQANRHFNPKKIDAETKKYRSLLHDLNKDNICKNYRY